MSELRMPCHPSDLTAGWLTHVLRQAGTLGETSVSEMRWEIIGQEWGFTGVVARVWLLYSEVDAGSPSSLVAKFPTDTQENPSLYARAARRDEASRRRAEERAAREIYAYQEMIPAGLAVPYLYYGAVEPETGAVVMLLEDLVEADPGDVLLGCSPSQAGLILDAIAPFHALWWEKPRLETLPWLPVWGSDLPARARRYAECVGPFLTRFGDRMPAEARDLVRRLVDAYLPLLSELPGAPSTAVHGDLHLDNVIFMPGNDRPVRLIDWQGVMRGPAVLDLTIVANSLPIDERRASEDDLLRHYHALLTEGIPGYPYHLLKRHYRLAMLWNLAGFVTWLGPANLEGLVGRQRAMVDAVVEEPRLLTAMLDNEVGNLLT